MDINELGNRLLVAARKESYTKLFEGRAREES